MILLLNQGMVNCGGRVIVEIYSYIILIQMELVYGQLPTQVVVMSILVLLVLLDLLVKLD
tara:strand:- start:558 stop:737 length:180 start_codon:yes stop_codon:yes gene_type:complete